MKTPSDPSLPGAGQEQLFDLQDYGFCPPVFEHPRRTMDERLAFFIAALTNDGALPMTDRKKKCVDNYRKFLTRLWRLQ
jgi:hypothetical protein